MNRGTAAPGAATDPPEPRTGPDGDRETTWPYTVIAAVCYLPMLLTSPGQVSADTKSFLYLDPGSLLRSATAMWDPGIALGYVPHQNIGYLWPMGPWFWVFDRLNVPDWVAQRLWWGTLFSVAGAGVVALARHVRWRDEAAVAAGFAYALSPYTLVFLARISGLLIPWAVLPWLILFAARAVKSQGWRYPALFALFASTAGSTNLTALVMVGVGAVVWVLHAAFIAHEAPVADVLRAAGRIGVLTLGASTWWLVGLLVQAGYGTDILRYSETAEVVTSASNAGEVLRGLGNWFFYGADRLGPWIEPSVAYTQRIPLLLITFALPVLALLLAASMRWRHRAFAIALVVVGLLLSVGAFPWDGPPPLGRLVQLVLLDERGLTFRALGRATPLLVLGVALLLGGAISAIGTSSRRAARLLCATVVVLAVAGLPPLWMGDLVPENLRRPQDVPSYWQDAADRLDSGDRRTRVLEIPGSDFASYRWGNTVDPITPGLIDRAVAYRELIPFGPPESAALLDALDLGLQEHTLPSQALGPIARLMRAGDLLLRSDLEFERFNTPRPKNLYDLVQRADGFGIAEGFGPGEPNRPDPSASLDDETWLLTDHLLDDPPEVAVFPVEDPIPIVSTKATDRPVVLVGDAFGVVDLAIAGLIDGGEVLRYSAELDGTELDELVADGGTVVITDTNRKRAQRWQAVRFTQGFTEPADSQLLDRDLTDNRLPFFDERGTDAETVSVQLGGVRANASSAGNRYTVDPADRPAAAIDGDARTAWRTGDLDDPRGEFLRLTLDEPARLDQVRLLQPTTKDPDRWITQVRLEFDDGSSELVPLDASSRRGDGQLVTFTAREVRQVDLEVVAVAGSEATGGGTAGVGFAEVELGDEPPVLEEWVRTPVDVVDRLAGRDVPLVVLLTRLRQDPTDFTRDDDERNLARIVTLPSDTTVQVSGSARLSARADDATLEAVLDRGGPVVVGAETRLVGSRETGAATLDGDPSTWWITPRSGPVGTAVRFSAAAPIELDHLDLQLVADGRFSVPTELEVSVDGGSPVVVPLPAVQPGDAPGSVASVRAALPEVLEGRHFVVRITDADVERVIDWNSREPIAQPVGIAELGVEGVSVPQLPDVLDTGCRDDLVEIDGAAVAVRITGSMEDALAGRPLTLVGCGAAVALGGGEHRIRTAIGDDIGIDVDQLVLRRPAAAATSALLDADRSVPATSRVVAASASRIEVELEGEPGADVWLVLGESWNHGWSAAGEAGEGSRLGAPDLIDGFANGWRVHLDDRGRASIVLQFLPQGSVRAGVILSLLTVVVCGVLILRGRRADYDDAPPPVLRRQRSERTLPLGRPQVVTGLGALAVALLVVPPLVALPLGLAAALGAWWRPAAVLVRLAPAGLALAAVATVIVQQVADETPSGGTWAASHRAAHLLTLVAVVLLVVDVIVARWWDQPDEAPAPRRRTTPLRAAPEGPPPDARPRRTSRTVPPATGAPARRRSGPAHLARDEAPPARRPDRGER